MKGGRSWKESSRQRRPAKRGELEGHSRFGAQVRINCDQMAGTKAGEQSSYQNRSFYHAEDFGLHSTEIGEPWK